MKELSELEKGFIHNFVWEDMNMSQAALAAGYSAGTNPSMIAKRLAKEIVEEVAKKVAVTAPEALKKLTDLLKEPTSPGGQLSEKVANSLLEKAGIVKKDKVEVEHIAPNAILILPPKNKEISGDE